MNNDTSFDVIVIGGGHAACEAALAAARVGASTLILAINLDHIAQMSCNPAIGGIAKGQVVREIDALGGAMGRVTDASSIQFRILNKTKGPAVWSPRAQCDKVTYQRAMKRELENQENLEIRQATVASFIIENGNITGVETLLAERFYAKSFVIATGTFLGGKLHYGLQNMPGGRAGDPPSTHLSDALKNQLGLRMGRLKTGTPPRILARSIDFSQMSAQESENPEEQFSFYGHSTVQPGAIDKQMRCYMVYTNEKTAQLVKDNLDKAPMYQGKIEGIGTRYCPSFEDKVVRFPHHEKHLIYLEPEGEFTGEYYTNGISTSLPPEIQIKMLRTLPGLEKVVLTRYAYAIEYDFIFPDQEERSLRNKKWPNLFPAGQINGTSGYEEAAAQGLVAGFNAARHAAGKDILELPRDNSYIGVMLDDIVTKEIVEPYRLFTSRAEYRLILRQDNADMRLSEFAYENGLLPAAHYKEFCEYRELCKKTEEAAKAVRHEKRLVWDLIKEYAGIMDAKPEKFPLELIGLDYENKLHRRALRQIAVVAHYEGYMRREIAAAEKLHSLESWKVPADFDYKTLPGLKNESRMKLEKVRPTTLAQAARIDGLTPPEIALLQVHINRILRQNASKTEAK